jgi:hypothetical protein
VRSRAPALERPGRGRGRDRAHSVAWHRCPSAALAGSVRTNPACGPEQGPARANACFPAARSGHSAALIGKAWACWSALPGTPARAGATSSPARCSFATIKASAIPSLSFLMASTGKAGPIRASRPSLAPSPARPGAVPGSSLWRDLTAHPLRAVTIRSVCGSATPARNPRQVRAEVLHLIGPPGTGILSVALSSPRGGSYQLS